MRDPRFFKNHGPFSIADLARIGQAQLLPDANFNRMLYDVGTLVDAESDHVTFFDNRKYLNSFLGTRAGACVVLPEFMDRKPSGTDVLISNNPYKSYALIAQAFYPIAAADKSFRHPAAIVDPAAKLADSCHIAAGAVIGAHVEIGSGTRIEQNAVIKDGVVIGQNCVIMAHATISHAIIGDRVVIYPGVRLGQPGFGFAPDAKVPVKVPQLGRVIVEDDVEIGANSTIDRGALGDTVIGAGTMIDNLVQIGHNVKIGRGCVIVSQVGISGSTVLEDYVQLGGQVGVAGHLRLSRGSKAAAKAGLMRDTMPGEVVGGYPAVPIKQWHRQTASLGQIARAKKTG